MNAVPKRYGGEDGRCWLRTIPMPDGGGLWVECEIVQPSSALGRTVLVFLDPADVTELLLDLRSSAIEARR